MHESPTELNLGRKLLVVGVHLKSEAYPNVLFRLRDLSSLGRIDLAELNVPMWNESSRRHHGLARLLRSVGSAAIAHLRLLWRLGCVVRPAVAYVPYPAVGVLLILAALPQRCRPARVVADAFVSVYETVVDDRGLIGRGSRLARLLRSLERRAYRCADKVIADTPQSAEYLRAEFGLEPRKVVALPLATDEGHYVPALYAPKGPPVRVLFVGTLIPLHGIDVISAAIAKLADREDIQFRVIGDGQEAAQLQAIAARGLRNLHWVREWRTSAEVAAEIRDADLCLGIFGAGRKTQRVCPLKLYAYAAVGRAIVTGDTRWYRQATAGLNYRPFDVVPVGRPGALVAKIVELAADPQRRMALAGDSRRFYEARLANRLALTSLLEVLFPEASASEEGR